MGGCPAGEKGCADIRLVEQQRKSDMILIDERMKHHTEMIVEASEGVEKCLKSVEKVAVFYQQQVDRFAEGNKRFEQDDARHLVVSEKIVQSEKDILILKQQLSNVQQSPTALDNIMQNKTKVATVGTISIGSIAIIWETLKYITEVLVSLIKGTG